MAVLASDVVCTFAAAPLPNSGARSCAGVYTFVAAPLPNSGARSVLWRGDCSEWARGMMTLYVCVVGDGYRPCTDGSRGPPFYRWRSSRLATHNQITSAFFKVRPDHAGIRLPTKPTSS